MPHLWDLIKKRWSYASFDMHKTYEQQLMWALDGRLFSAREALLHALVLMEHHTDVMAGR